jgi:hypothetical protein
MSIKYAFLFFSLSLFSIRAAVFTFDQGARATATATTVTFGSPNTAGNIIIATMASPGGFPATSVTDSAGNSYTLITAPLQATAGGSFNGVVFIATGIASNASNTVTFHGINVGSNEWSLIIAEYNVPSKYNLTNLQFADIDSGLSQVVVSQPYINVGSAGLPAEIMVIPIIWTNCGSGALAFSHGTLRESQTSGGSFFLALADFDVTSPSAPVSTTVTCNGGTFGSALGMSVALDPGSSGGGSSVPGGFGFVAQLEKKKLK